MHTNGVLLQRLFTALNQHDHTTMASCYHPEATFRDIAFDLTNSKSIQDMWNMICKCSDIEATFEIIDVDYLDGRVKLVADYTYKDTRRRVHNVIDSRFRFQDGLIIEHRDSCDACVWAAMAFGCGLRGFVAARSRMARSWVANKKLKKFIQSHYECESA